MTVADILEQVKTLSVDERKELLKRLIDMLCEPQAPLTDEPTEVEGNC